MNQVSVVIVNYNSGLFLERCIRSVLQSNCLIEIIVVDNASKDNSVEFLESLKFDEISLKVLRNPTNLGFSAAVNIGVESSTGKYVLLLNPDCLVLPHTIRFLSEVLEEETGTGIVGGLVFNFEGSEQQGCRRREPTLTRSIVKVLRSQSGISTESGVDLTDQPLPDQWTAVDAVSGSFLMIRRELFASLDGMDEEFFLHFEDLDLCRRVRDAGWKVLFAPDISIFHYQGGSSAKGAVAISWHKHRGMQRYHRIHHGGHLGIHAVVLLVVWGHFVLQIARRIAPPNVRNSVVVQSDLSADAETFPWMVVSPKNVGNRRILVLGKIDRIGEIFLHLGIERGWSVYTECQVEGEPQTTGIHWINPEYLTKVSVRDAPEFSAVLSFDQSPPPSITDENLKKFRVQRVALVRFSGGPEEFVDGDSQFQFDKDTCYDSEEWGRISMNSFSCEARIFSVPVSDRLPWLEHEQREFEKFAERCYSFLAE